MSETINQSLPQIDIILPKQGLLYKNQSADFVFCKPKLIPLKSITLEKLEKMQKEAEMKIRKSEAEEK